MRRIQFIVTVPLIDGVPSARWHAYIEEAIKSWAGQYEPVHGGYPDSAAGSGDPMGPPCEWGKLVEVRRLR